MLQRLLADRFALRVRHESKPGPVYLLTRGSGELRLKPTERTDLDARAGVMMKSGGIADGEAFGQNISMGEFARILSADLQVPVIDETGLKDAFEIRLSYQEGVAGSLEEAVAKLGLKLVPARRAIEYLIVTKKAE